MTTSVMSLVFLSADGLGPQHHGQYSGCSLKIFLSFLVWLKSGLDIIAPWQTDSLRLPVAYRTTGSRGRVETYVRFLQESGLAALSDMRPHAIIPESFYYQLCCH